MTTRPLADDPDPTEQPPITGPRPILYSPLQAARALGIGRSTLYVLLADGSIPSVRIGAARRIRAHDLEAFANQLPDEPGTHTGRRVVTSRSPRATGTAASHRIPEEELR